MKSKKYFTSLITLFIPVLLFLFFVNGCGTGSNSDAGPTFDSGFLAPGETFSFTFEEEGTVDYFCETHSPNMTGQVIVKKGAAISGRDTVALEDIQFKPSQITVAPNTEIVWVNRESSTVADHTVSSGTPTTDDDGGGY